MAQFLSQHATTRGIFRIPGSVRIVNALFDYYCYTENGGMDVASTVRCSNLPVHIQSSVHDVASTFKRMLSVLPGGILGTLSIFDAFVAIHSHLHGDPEFPRTKQTKVRARLLALAIGSIESQFRRELICAVFGLLSLIGRAAEVAPREDEDGRPLPTADLMGYSALGIVFGPLLVGELLYQYNMNLAKPDTGLVLLPISPRKLRKGCRRPPTNENVSSGPPTMDKIYIANSVTEMLISNWRDVVRQMKSLGMHLRKDVSMLTVRNGSLRPSISESFIIKKSEEWARPKRNSAVQVDRERSPEPTTPISAMKRQRPRSKKSFSSNRLRAKPSTGVLSPTAEESLADEESLDGSKISWHQGQFVPRVSDAGTTTSNIGTSNVGTNANMDLLHGHPAREASAQTFVSAEERPRRQSGRSRRKQATFASTEVSMDDVPARVSSRQGPVPDSSIGYPSIQPGRPSKVPPREVDSSEFLLVRKRSKRPSVFDLDDLDDDTNQTPRSARTSHGRRVSQASQISFQGARKAVESRIGVPKRDIAGLEAERPQDFASLENSGNDSFLSPKANTTSRSPRIRAGTGSTVASRDTQTLDQDQNENYRSPRPRTMTRSSVASRDEYTQTQETFYLSPNGNIERQITKKLPDPIQRGSISTTPVHFYAPMRVPPGLSGESALPNPLQQETWKVAAEDSGKKTPSILRVGKSGLANPSVEEENVDAFQNDRPWKISTLSRERLRQFEQGEAAQSSPSKIPVISPSKLLQRGTSETGSTRGGVKAMAAKFESPPKPSPPKLGGRDLSFLTLESETTKSSPTKSLRTSKSVRVSSSGPVRDKTLESDTTKSSPSKSFRTSKSVRVSSSGPIWDNQNPKRSSWSAKSISTPDRPNANLRKRSSWSAKSMTAPSISSLTDANQQEEARIRSLHNSVSEGVANRAAAIIEAEKQLQASSEGVANRAAAIMEAEKQQEASGAVRQPLAKLRQPGSWKKPTKQSTPESVKDYQSQMKVASSLGTMIPHQEQPPVAQHLNFARPASAMSDNSTIPRTSTPIPRPRSTTFLHTQVRNLQRQVESKTDEINQLRRQVEAQENSEVGTLSQQLREAKAEAQMWKERAEAAERRVKVFERFTARLKGIREAATSAGERTHNFLHHHKLDKSTEAAESDDDAGSGVRYLEGHVKTGSADSGKTEDAGVVTARIKHCLHGGDPGHTDPGHTDGAEDILGLVGFDGPSTPYHRNVSLGAMEIWMAAQELLLEDTGRLEVME